MFNINSQGKKYDIMSKWHGDTLANYRRVRDVEIGAYKSKISILTCFLTSSSLRAIFVAYFSTRTINIIKLNDYFRKEILKDPTQFWTFVQIRFTWLDNEKKSSDTLKPKKK